MIKIIFLSVFCLFIAMPVIGEYYQYEDSQGNLRFTDDTANIPENGRVGLKAYESVPNYDLQVPVDEDTSLDASKEAESAASSTDAMVEKPLPTREALDKMRSALNQTAASLEAEHKGLEAQKPDKNTPSPQMKAYFEKARAWNDKMNAYEKQEKIYSERVKAYNTQIQRDEKSRSDAPNK